MIAPRSTTVDVPPPRAESFLPEAVGILWRYRRRAVVFAGVTMLLVLAGLLIAPRVYMSEAKLFVRVGRQSITLDPTATTGKTISVYESRENEITSVLDVLSSRVILERVAETIGPAEILNKKKTVAGDQEKAIRQLERAVYTTHTRKSSVITVGCKTRSPELAQRIVQAVLDAFNTQHVRVNRTAGSFEFFVHQSELADKQLREATDRLRDAKNKIGLASIEGQRTILQGQIAAVKSETVTNSTALAASRSRIAALRSTLDKLPNRLVSQQVTGFPQDAAGQTKTRLYQLKIREQELLTQYAEQHPQVIAVRRQIEQAQQLLASGNPADTQSTSAANPAYQQIFLKLLNEQANLKALEAGAATLGAQSERLNKQLQALNSQEGEIDRLEQRVDLLQVSHRAYAEKREQARIDTALADAHISNVNTVQPPTLIAKPVSPKKRLIAAIGLLFAMAGGVGLAFGSEYLTRLFPRENSSAETSDGLTARQLVTQEISHGI